jgi:hypothetical protein
MIEHQQWAHPGGRVLLFAKLPAPLSTSGIASRSISLLMPHYS